MRSTTLSYGRHKVVQLLQDQQTYQMCVCFLQVEVDLPTANCSIRVSIIMRKGIDCCLLRLNPMR